MQQQQLKLRDRQKFFEEVFQHDVDFFFPMSHLQIEHRRPPLGSISSMEVNVDMLEQMDMMDLSDQDTVDVFLGCGTEESSVAEPLTVPTLACSSTLATLRADPHTPISRIPSTSSVSTDLNSLDTSEEGAETPVVQSDEEDLQEDSPREQPGGGKAAGTSSVSTDLNSLDTSEEGAETPVVQSDEEDLQEDSPREQVARS
ncbi:PREDICTED: dysbindin domain-containing protein 2 [Buceros rhinoceros silvestris]|uniref:dysbindin domain-containing protein 2 n=1 Tax=Buceros rhinoceros silvestris TaxID=175836 RepID=UPI0005288884|nr:PREDICTED: dysbindin domain-containing protein 2 [Buceros rhinoceros silvestris]